MVQTNPKSDITLEIESLAHGAWGIGRHEGRVIMVAGAVPGDRVSARIIESKGTYAIAQLNALIASSSSRRQPPCPYVGACGGCPWQQIDYAAQLAAKQRNLESALRRIGKLTDFEILPIVAAPREFNYRRRIQLRCSGNGEIGFFGAASHKLVAIDACAVAAEPVNRMLEDVRVSIAQMRSRIVELEIVAGEQENELVIVASVDGPLLASDSAAFARLVTGVSAAKGIIVTAGHRRHVWGDPRITVIPEPGIELLVSADIFTQVNPDGNRLILQRLLAAGNFTGRDRALELFCGAGNFTLSIARRAGEVVAVEGRRDAVEYGRLNAQRYGIENIRWHAAFVPATVAQLARRKECFDKIILDPPRAGAKGIDRDMAVLKPEIILYVSCNPPTLARDLAALAKHGYRLTTVQAVDLFPQTFHLESLAVVKRE